MSKDHVTKVLMIEDCETDRLIYRRYLQQGTLLYQVHEAEDGEKGLTLARTIHPDCILLDLSLPGGKSGLEVLEELIGEAPPKRVVIILSGVNRESLQKGALSLGAAAYLFKDTTDAAALDLTIRQAIGKPPFR
jgi:DNA-binding NarL/FixJ family response regulator